MNIIIVHLQVYLGAHRAELILDTACKQSFQREGREGEGREGERKGGREEGKGEGGGRDGGRGEGREEGKKEEREVRMG